MTVSQYDHVVPYTDLGGRGYFGVNAALVGIDGKDKNICGFYKNKQTYNIRIRK